MANLRHIRIKNTETTLSYTYPLDGRTPNFTRPVRNRGPHADLLRQQLRDAVATTSERHDGAPPESCPVDLEFR